VRFLFISVLLGLVGLSSMTMANEADFRAASAQGGKAILLHSDSRPSPEQAGLYVLQPTSDSQNAFITLGSLSSP
jgi:hypothetical protein